MVILIVSPLRLRMILRATRTKKNFMKRSAVGVAALEKEFRMGELSEVFVFCGLYSSVVVYTLWMTVSDRIKTN